jgi:DNA mismatch endonuclease, patch repair protein
MCHLGGKPPLSNQDYWLPKLARNVERDMITRQALKRLGWRVMVIWECETKDALRLIPRIAKFLKTA